MSKIGTVIEPNQFGNDFCAWIADDDGNLTKKDFDTYEEAVAYLASEDAQLMTLDEYVNVSHRRMPKDNPFEAAAKRYNARYN